MQILFDYGGVLVDLDRRRCEAAFDALGFDIRPYLGTYAQSGIFSQFERGELSVPGFCEAFRRLSGRPDLADEAITDAWRQYLVGVPDDRLDALLRLRRHYRLHILSNTNPVHWQLALDRHFRRDGLTVADFFDRCFLSYELGVEKPAPEIFRAVTDGLGCAPADILFLDDSEANCAAARRCGLQARLVPAGGAWLAFFSPEGYYIP